MTRDERPEPAAFSFASSGDSLFDKAAAQIGINEATLNIGDSSGQRFISKGLFSRDACERFGLKNTQGSPPTLRNIALRRIKSNSSWLDFAVQGVAIFPGIPGTAGVLTRFCFVETKTQP